jgi:Uma2 family endonuclease
MVTSASKQLQASEISEVVETLDTAQFHSLANFVTHPIDDAEWVDGKVVEKTGMTVKTGVVQGRLNRFWGNYASSNGQGGESCTEAPCRTLKQVRRPDVAYITPELLTQYGQPATFPQSFPLIAEIASPTDSAYLKCISIASKTLARSFALSSAISSSASGAKIISYVTLAH